MVRDSIARKPREMAVSKAYHAGRTSLGYYPIHLDIESTSICNLDCPMCPYPEMRIKKGNMSLDLFKNIIDQCDGKVFDVLLHMYGEPLVNKEIFKMISYAKEKGVRITSMSTNLTLLTREKAKQLIEAGLDKITLSFDGTDKTDIRRSAARRKLREVPRKPAGLSGSETTDEIENAVYRAAGHSNAANGTGVEGIRRTFSKSTVDRPVESKEL